MTKFFDDPEKLFQYVQEQAMDVMNKEVAKESKDLLSQHVEDDVYDAYTSQNPYKDRREDDGGLSDTDNMIHTVTNTVNGMELFVKNISNGNPNITYQGGVQPPNYLAGIIEYGREPNRKGLYAYNQTGTEDEFLRPRPFISNTASELSRTLEHLEWFKDGMKRRGIKLD